MPSMESTRGGLRVGVAVPVILGFAAGALILSGTAFGGRSIATDPIQDAGPAKQKKQRPRPCDCRALKVAGRWSGTGTDKANTTWNWTMELNQKGCSLKGVITWRASSGSAGREHIQGRLKCSSLRFDFRGQQMEAAEGAIILGIYYSQFSRDLRRIKGGWTNGIPGTFQGSKQ